MTTTFVQPLTRHEKVLDGFPLVGRESGVVRLGDQRGRSRPRRLPEGCLAAGDVPVLELGPDQGRQGLAHLPPSAVHDDRVKVAVGFRTEQVQQRVLLVLVLQQGTNHNNSIGQNKKKYQCITVVKSLESDCV